MSKFERFIQDQIGDSIRCYSRLEANSMLKTLNNALDVKAIGPNEQFETYIRTGPPSDYGERVYEVVLDVIQFFPPDVLIQMIKDEE